jgi:phosphoserine phosphatase
MHDAPRPRRYQGVVITTPGRIDPARLRDRLARAHAEAGCPAERLVLATDADGTLWSGDVGEDLFTAALAERALRDAAKGALAAEAEANDVDATGDANAIAGALYAAFEDGRYPLDRAFSMMAWAFAGFSTAELRRFVDRVLDAARIDARLRPELAVALAWAREASIEAWVVSASPQAIVEAAAARAGIASDHVLGMRPAEHGGVVAPRLAGPVVYGEGKLEALFAACPGATILAAFGDSAYDAPMLRRARVPVAVHPSSGLLDLAHTIPGVLVVGARG